MADRLIAIGDTHGKSVWESLPAVMARPYPYNGEKLIFMGDYFDSFTINGAFQIANFKKILSLKQANPEEVILLIGNHDFQYCPFSNEQYSGYNHLYASEITELLTKALPYMQITYQHDNYLFSHAGITKTWLENLTVLDLGVDDINDVFTTRPALFGFNHADTSKNGSDIRQSPLWVRPHMLQQDKVPGYIQVIGHTPMPELVISDDLILTDCLDTVAQVLLIEDGEPRVLDLV